MIMSCLISLSLIYFNQCFLCLQAYKPGNELFKLAIIFKCVFEEDVNVLLFLNFCMILNATQRVVLFILLVALCSSFRFVVFHFILWMVYNMLLLVSPDSGFQQTINDGFLLDFFIVFCCFVFILADRWKLYNLLLLSTFLAGIVYTY